MPGSVHGRLVPINTTLFDQADFFQLDGFTRVEGLDPGDLQIKVFFNNAVQPWSLVSGAGVTDALVQSGRVYWNEIPGAPGFYGMRWRPNAVGYWRVLVSYTVGRQIVAQDYDVASYADEATGGSGLKVSFVAKGC